MANKFDKMIANGNTKKKKKGYSYKSLTCDYLILYPLMVVVYWFNQLKDKQWEALCWNEKRTTRIIDNYLLKRAEVDQEEQSLMLWIQNWGFDISMRGCCKRWDKSYCNKFSREIKQYIFEDYQIDGYTKTIEKQYEWTLVEFKKN